MRCVERSLDPSLADSTGWLISSPTESSLIQSLTHQVVHLHLVALLSHHVAVVRLLLQQPRAASSERSGKARQRRQRAGGGCLAAAATARLSGAWMPSSAAALFYKRNDAGKRAGLASSASGRCPTHICVPQSKEAASDGEISADLGPQLTRIVTFSLSLAATRLAAASSSTRQNTPLRIMITWIKAP